MKTVLITLEEEFLARVDRAARKLGTTRSAFARKALREALARLGELERKHRRGYLAKPVRRREFDVWRTEQVWPR